MSGIHYQSPYADTLQCGIGTFPINACAFHHHDVGFEACNPFRHATAVSLKPAKLTQVDFCLTLHFLNDRHQESKKGVYQYPQNNDTTVEYPWFSPIQLYSGTRRHTLVSDPEHSVDFVTKSPW